MGILIWCLEGVVGWRDLEVDSREETRIRTAGGNGTQQILLDKGKNTSDYREIPHGGDNYEIFKEKCRLNIHLNFLFGPIPNLPHLFP